MSKFVRLEVWDQFEANSGTRQSVFSRILDLVETVEVMGTDRLVVTVPFDEPALAAVTARQILRVVYNDGAEQVREWRIDTRTTIRKDNKLTVKLEADPVLMELVNEEIVFQETDGINRLVNFQLIGMTVSDQLDQILNSINVSSDFTWTAGTIDASDPVVDVVYDWDTPLSALLKLAELSELEINIRKDGVTGYFIDMLLLIGSAAPQVELRVSANLPELNRREVSDEQATVIQPRGQVIGVENGRLDRNMWIVQFATSGPPDAITLRPAHSFDQLPSPIAFDDQYNGHYLFYDDLFAASGFVGPIIDTIFVGETFPKVTITDITPLVSGSVVAIVPGNTAREALSFIENPPAILTQGRVRKVLDRPDIPGYHNYGANSNSDMSNPFISGIPSHWGVEGGATITENTDTAFIKTGDRSAKVVCTNNGDGIASQFIRMVRPELGTTLLDMVSWWMNFYVDSSAGGRVLAYAEFQSFGAGGSGLLSTYQFPTNVNDANKAFTEREKQWIELGVAGNDPVQNFFADPADPLDRMRLFLVQDGSTAVTFFLDNFMISKSAVHVPFVRVNGSSELLIEANKYLVKHALRDVEYTLRAIDLERIDSTTWPDYEFVLGQTARVVDVEAGISDTVRLVSIGRNWLVAGDTKLGLSTTAKTLSNRLAIQKIPFSPRRISIDGNESPNPAAMTGGSGGGTGSLFGVDGWELGSQPTQNTAKAVAIILPRNTDKAYLTPHGTNVTRLVVRVPSNATLTVGTITVSVVKGENAGATTADATVDTVLEIDITSGNIAQAAADGGLAVEIQPAVFQLPSGHDLVVAYSTTATITQSNMDLRVSLEVSKMSGVATILAGPGPSFRSEQGNMQVVTGTGTSRDESDTPPFLGQGQEQLVAFVLWFKRTGESAVDDVGFIFADRQGVFALQWRKDASNGGPVIQFVHFSPAAFGTDLIWNLDMLSSGGLQQWIGVAVSYDRTNINNKPVIKVIDPALSVDSFVAATTTEYQTLAGAWHPSPLDGWCIGGDKDGGRSFIGNISNVQVWSGATLPTESEMLSALVANAPGPSSPDAHYLLESDLRSDIGTPFHDVFLAELGEVQTEVGRDTFVDTDGVLVDAHTPTGGSGSLTGWEWTTSGPDPWEIRANRAYSLQQEIVVRSLDDFADDMIEHKMEVWREQNSMSGMVTICSDEFPNIGFFTGMGLIGARVNNATTQRVDFAITIRSDSGVNFTTTVATQFSWVQGLTKILGIRRVGDTVTLFTEQGGVRIDHGSVILDAGQQSLFDDGTHKRVGFSIQGPFNTSIISVLTASTPGTTYDSNGPPYA